MDDLLDLFEDFPSFWMTLVLIIVMLALTASGACNIADKDMVRIMRQEGVSDYRNKGAVYFGCGHDAFGTNFSGVKNGVAVRGAVCGGWGKDYTIRYE